MHKLLHACFSDDDKFFIYIPTSVLAKKKVIEFFNYTSNPDTIWFHVDQIQVVCANVLLYCK